MKKSFYTLGFISLFLIIFFRSHAQYNCSSAPRLQIFDFQTSVNCTLSPAGTLAQNGPDYGCLSYTTRPIWGYFAICENDLSFLDLKFTFNNIPLYIDTVGLIIWGPFQDQTVVCSQLTASKIMYCDDQLLCPNNYRDVYLFSAPPRSFYYFMLTVRDNSLHTNVEMAVVDYQAGVTTWPFDSCNICNNEVSYLEDERLCVVSLDSATGKNKLVWEKNNNKGIARYDLYKEGFVAGIFDSIGNVSFNSFSEFIDVNSNPAQQSYKYNIKAVDSCNYKLTNSYGSYFYHTTIHLITYPAGNNQASLTWNNYGGAATTGTTYIYRNNLLIDSVPSSLINYTDLNAPSGTNSYQVEQRLIASCNPSRMTSTGYLSTQSNLSQVVVTGISQANYESNIFNLFPNPTTSTIQLTFNTKHNGAVQCEIMSVMGEKVFQKELQTLNFKLQTTLDVSFLEKGIYFIKVNADGRSMVQKVVKM